MILSAAWVVPVSAPPIRNGFVEIRGARIVRVGRAAELPADLPRQDLGAALLTPGLVNPHTHLELTCYAGKLPPADFWTWIARLVALRREPGQLERESAGVAEGARQSLRAGVTCVGDISRLGLHWPVLKWMRIRKVCYVELLSVADSPPRTIDELRAAAEQVEEDELLTVGISPHAPYTVPEPQIRAAIALAAALGRPWCLHWAETPGELAFLRGEPVSAADGFLAALASGAVAAPRCGAMEFLERVTAGLPRGLMAHGNYVSDEELPALAASGHAIVFCPRAHRFFGHAPHPFARMAKRGVRVVIGTDSAASNEGLSPLEELRAARQLPGAPPDDALFRMATIEAAAALGLGDRIGSLEAGKLADLAAFPCAPGESDPLRALLTAAPAALAVWVGGERVSE